MAKTLDDESRRSSIHCRRCSKLLPVTLSLPQRKALRTQLEMLRVDDQSVHDEPLGLMVIRGGLNRDQGFPWLRHVIAP